jgi:ATP-GRASP peptide maturase of grasp-with-spasm system
VILIFSESQDGITQDVMAYLKSFGQQVILVDESNPIKFSKFTLNNRNEDLILDYKGNLISSSNIKSVWFRRGSFTRSEPILDRKSIVLDFLNYNLKLEEQSLIEAIYEHLRFRCFIVSDPRLYQVNKIDSLRKAKVCGLDIPTTLIAKEKSYVSEFKKKSKIITKGIQEVFEMSYENKVYFNQTERITDKILERMGQSFFPTLFQNEIQKVFEIRTFYFCGLFYSMAIFSQNDKTTAVDFRNYNDSRPNRMLPFVLPEDVKEKIAKFMKIMKLETGSIDLIYSQNNKYIFLEVNPVGQLEFLSNNCNYPIAKDIAEILKNGERPNL